MKVVATDLPEVLLIETPKFSDSRGHFFESYNRRALAELGGIAHEFVQENQSRSGRGVLRGLHYQIRQAQGKLVRILHGTVYDVAVDLRKSSPSFGRWSGVTLSAEDRRMLWIPPGFAHGFLVLSDTADFLYKVTEYWAPEHERTIRWDDPALAIPWPLSAPPILSEKDRHAPLLPEAEIYP